MIRKESWYRELEAREMSLPYDPEEEPGGVEELDESDEE